MQEKFGDTKGIIRSRKMKDRQHNGYAKTVKRKNNDLQNNKELSNTNPLKIRGAHSRSGRVSSTSPIKCMLNSKETLLDVQFNMHDGYYYTVRSVPTV